MLKVNELFSGIGAFRKALINLEIEHEVVGIAEIDKYAIKSYEAMYGQVHNYGDISKSLKLEYADMWTYGFPCQDISVAGKQAGIERHTRSGLLYQVQRLLEVAYQYDELPKYLILENVKNLVGKKFRADFDEWLNYLNELGYNNYWKVLNAKNYGVPQNRERVFVVSIRKDIDTGYESPLPFDNGVRLKDVLEDEVDEKFYLNDKQLAYVLDLNETQNGTKWEGRTNAAFLNNSIARTIGCRSAESQRADLTNIIVDNERYDIKVNEFKVAIKEDGDPSFTLTSQDRHGVMQVGMLDIKGNEQVRRVYAEEGCSPTLNTMQGGNRQPKIMVKEATKFGKMESPENIVSDFLKDNDITEPMALDEQNKYIRKDFCVGTITTDGSSPKKNNRIVEPIVQATIQRIDIPQTVCVRKNQVDTESLVKVLRESKSNKGITNKQISEFLSKPITEVEHWFRTDSCFAIPDPSIWMQLKELLGISTCEFDDSVMEFEERIGTYEKSERCYLSDGISPTLTSASADEKVIHDYRIRKLTPKECFRLMGFSDSDFQKCVDAGISNSQLYKQAGNSIVVDVLFYMLKNLLGE